MEFDGLEDSINCGSAAALDDLAAFTYVVWIYPTSITEADSHLLTKIGTGVKVFALTTNGRFYFYMDRATTDLHIRSVDGSIAINTPQCIAVTWDGSTAKLYVNGVEPSYATNIQGAGAIVTDATGNFSIGLYPSVSVDGFAGIVADFRVYNAALSASILLRIASARLKYYSESGNLIAYWPLDDGVDGASGDAVTYRDRVGTNNGTGDNGANNTGLTNRASSFLSYP